MAQLQDSHSSSTTTLQSANMTSPEADAVRSSSKEDVDQDTGNTTEAAQEKGDIEAGASSQREHAAPVVGPAPDGGLVAWLQVIGGFLLFFNSWGIINTFGVFQSYYETNLLRTYSASSISWIGTVQGFFIFLAGVVVGPIFDKGYLRSVLIFGTFLVVFGLMMTSLSTEYYQVFLSQGVAVGLGTGFLFLPSVAVVATYFTSKRAIATGIMAAGGSIGSVIYPVMFHRLINPLGFGWTTRIIAFVILAGLLFSIAVMKLRLPPPKQARSLFDLSAFKEPAFMLFSTGMFFAFIGLYLPFFYMPTFFISYLHNDGNMAFYIIAVLNAASVFGRIMPGFLADKVGSLNSIIPVGYITSILAFAWIGIGNEAGTIVFAVLYGFTSGAMVSLPPTVIARLTPDLSLVGTRMGMTFIFAGVGLLIGNPIAGTLLEFKTPDDAVFWRAQLFSAIMVLVGTVFFTALRVLKWKQGHAWKI